MYSLNILDYKKSARYFYSYKSHEWECQV